MYVMTLREYRAKRDFTQTAEPRGGSATKMAGTAFVVQEHQAKRLHWDLRLEMAGLLRSWAVPKSPPVTAGVKRLAIQVEDHPLEYATFEGRIPDGEYGAGTVKIWDRGTYEATKVTEGKIMLVFHGEKLRGPYVMIKTKFTEDSWLLFKMKEA
jgi:DNA ligase D-like protein (predicted 3'-phosphoesterase)